MEYNEKILQEVVTRVVTEMLKNKGQEAPTERKVRETVKTDYSSYPVAKKGSDPKEVVIGVGAAFQTEIHKTINGISLDEVLKNIKAGIEEEGMHVFEWWGGEHRPLEELIAEMDEVKRNRDK